jgi:hypothetical protein
VIIWGGCDSFVEISVETGLGEESGFGEEGFKSISVGIAVFVDVLVNEVEGLLERINNFVRADGGADFQEVAGDPWGMGRMLRDVS